MSKTRKLQLKGTIEWAKVFEQNRDKEGWNGSYEDCNGACTVNMILDKENLKILKDSGTSKELDNDKKKTEKGYDVKFVRKFEHPDFPVFAGPPKVAKADGTPWDIDVDGLIGNGSVGIVYLSLYENASGKIGTRLDGLQVLDHVEFESEGDFGGPDFKDYSSTPNSDSDDDDDSIPF
ncbi:MAG: hypothetical protein COA78_20470 [Blastopirellula sp.]|nr:MAG: hypothetical protein COA78_20470 [Blastopirellula sp.]